MLRFSKKADYAILLLSHLARETSATGDWAAGDVDAPLRSAQELASATGLSPSMTANILKDYARQGILASVRGANGGYRLACDASTLSLREILEVTEGPIHLVDCAEHGSGDDAQAADVHSACCHAGICPSRRPLQALQDRISEMLDTIPLLDLTSPKRACLASDIPPSGTPTAGVPSQV